MVKSNYCVSFDREIMEWIENNRTKENTPSKILTKLIRKKIDEDPFKNCEVCGERYVRKIGHCPHCANNENDKEMDRVNKVLEEKDKEKDKEKEQDRQGAEEKEKREKIKDLNIRLRKRKEILESYQYQGDQEGIKLSEEQIKGIESQIKEQ